MDVSVILPAYNEENWIEPVLQALRSQKPAEIIVVDNNSTDGTAKIAKKYADKILTQKQQGIALSRNLGAEKASSPILAFLDADCIPGPKWLESVRASFTEKTIAATGPISPLNQTIKNRLAFRLAWTWLSKAMLFLGSPTLPGGNCAYLGQPFRDSGGFRTDIFPGEDIDLSHRLRNKGRFGFNPEMQVRTRTLRFDKFGYLPEIRMWLKVYWNMKLGQEWQYLYPTVR